jgi:hypothetical protein
MTAATPQKRLGGIIKNKRNEKIKGSFKITYHSAARQPPMQEETGAFLIQHDAGHAASETWRSLSFKINLGVRLIY